MAKFNKGDNVRLQPDAPHMKVEGHTTDGKSICVWFINNELKRDIFSEESLEKVEEDSGKPIYTGQLFDPI